MLAANKGTYINITDNATHSSVEGAIHRHKEIAQFVACNTLAAVQLVFLHCELSGHAVSMSTMHQS